jgi:hypothetical protein
MSAAGKLIYVFSRVLRHSHTHTYTCIARKMGRCEEEGVGCRRNLWPETEPTDFATFLFECACAGRTLAGLGVRTPALFSFSLSVRLLTPFTPTPAQRRAHTHYIKCQARPGGVCICNLMLPYYNNIIPWRTAFSLCSVLSAIFHLLHSHNGHALEEHSFLSANWKRENS